MSNFSFNLVTEPWIPCILPNGMLQEKGLLDTLANAHEIREIFDPSPLVTASLHRLMLAILHRNFGPAGVNSWKAIWGARLFNRQILQDYLNKWRSRFDLFDEERPFYQVKKFPSKSKEARIGLLRQELAGGNNATLFDHNLDDSPLQLSPVGAVRYLLAYHTYALGGLSGLDRNFTDSPAARSVTVFIRGKNLFETLCLNLIKYDQGNPMPGDKDDKPIWETDTPDFTRNTPRGYLDFLTWQGRSFQLIPEDTGKGGIAVNRIKIGLGREIDRQYALDPLTAWNEDPKKGWLPLRFNEGKALWRDSMALFWQASKDKKSPKNINWIGDLKWEDVLDANIAYIVDALGMGSDQAKIEFWRHEHMPLPLAYLGNNELVNRLGSALSDAGKGAKALNGALWVLGISLLSSGERTPETEDVRKCVGHLAADSLYWSRLEGQFYRFLTNNLPQSPDHEKTLMEWSKRVIKTARESFDDVVRDLDRSARTHKAVVSAGAKLNKELKTLCPKD